MAATEKAYEVDLPDDISMEEGLAFVRRKGAEVGIRLRGNANEGTFDGMAEGRYAVRAGQLVLTIEKKPGFVPWSMVRGGLARVFGEVREVE